MLFLAFDILHNLTLTRVHMLSRRLRSVDWRRNGLSFNGRGGVKDSISRFGKRNQYMLLRKGRDTSSEEAELELIKIEVTFHFLSAL